MSFRSAKTTVTAVLAVPALLFATTASAHAHLVKSDPAANATVAAPKTVHLHFNEKLEAKFSAADLMTAAGAPVAVRSKAAGKGIEATPKAPLARGAYMVMWHVLSADGHKSQGSYNFTVK